jgi:hypothetical protein
LKNSGYDVVIVGGNAALCMAGSVFGAALEGAKPTPLHPHPTRESRHEACRAHAV